MNLYVEDWKVENTPGSQFFVISFEEVWYYDALLLRLWASARPVPPVESAASSELVAHQCPPGRPWDNELDYDHVRSPDSMHGTSDEIQDG